MQVKLSRDSDTKAKLIIAAGSAELAPLKEHVLTHFQNSVKVPGFRPGNIPANVLEKHVDQGQLQQQFIQEAIEHMYVQAINNEKLRPVGQPEVSLKKFVPYTELEFHAEVSVVGPITLIDYKKVRMPKPELKITAKDVQGVIDSLRTRLADKKEVTRAAKETDEVLIDFSGVDDKKHQIKGAEGKDYPIILGSNTFIPGFESNLIGLKAGEQKTFTLTFPKDYGVKAMANKKVTFTATVTKVQEVVQPKVDDEFAAKAGPFKTIEELKADIKKQLKHERQHELNRNYEGQLIQKITEGSKVSIPDPLIDDQIERDLTELKQNLSYRGQTYDEFLESDATTDKIYREKVLKPSATERVKAGLVLAEISDKEELEVTPEELEIRIQILKGQYKDQAMQAELEKPENRRDIAARLLTEKTVAKLVEYATS